MDEEKKASRIKQWYADTLAVAAAESDRAAAYAAAYYFHHNPLFPQRRTPRPRNYDPNVRGRYEIPPLELDWEFARKRAFRNHFDIFLTTNDTTYRRPYARKGIRVSCKDSCFYHPDLAPLAVHSVMDGRTLCHQSLSRVGETYHCMEHAINSRIRYLDGSRSAVYHDGAGDCESLSLAPK